MTQELNTNIHGHNQCHSEGAVFSKKKGDRRISPPFPADETLRQLVASLALAFIVSLCIASPTHAQTTTTNLELNPSLETAHTIEVDPTLGLPSPETANEVANDAVQSKPTPPAPSNTPSNKSRLSNTDMRLQQIETENRAEAIRNRIDLLKSILARKKADAETAKRAAQTLTFPPEMTPQPTSPRITPAVLAPPESAPPEPNANRDPPSDPATETLPTPETDANAPSGTPVLSSPVNSFELANSLFATGNHNGALRSYEALLENENSVSDTNWIKCLAANCYRISGDQSKAESLYREVAASKDKSYPSDHSIWYLDHLTRRKRLEAELRAINGELQTMSPQP